MFEVDWPDHWKIAKLGDKAELKNGINFKKEQKGQGILTVDVLNMYSDGIYLDRTNLYRVDCKIRDRDLLRANDILFVRSSLKQEGVAWASLFGGHETPMTFCGFLIRARLTTSEINHEFLTHYFRTDFARRFLVSKSARLAITNISQATLSSCSIPLPPLPEQRAIAYVLQTIQEAKAARQRELALERERKAALMDYLFSHGTKGEPRKQAEIGEIPESWAVVELGNYSELITKGSSPRWQGFDYCDEGICFVRSQNVGLGRLELNEIAYLPKGFNKKEKKSILQKNDLLINIVGASIGRTAVVNDVVEGGNVNQAVAIARLKQGVEPLFVMTFLLTLGGQFQLHKQKKDIARANLSLQDINNLLIPLPPVSEQTETVEILQACDTKIVALEQEIALLNELFHTMLDELMTGQRCAVPLIDSELPN